MTDQYVFFTGECCRVFFFYCLARVGDVSVPLCHCTMSIDQIFRFAHLTRRSSSLPSPSIEFFFREASLFSFVFGIPGARRACRYD